MRKNFLSVVLTLCLCIGLLPTNAHALDLFPTPAAPEVKLSKTTFEVGEQVEISWTDTGNTYAYYVCEFPAGYAYEGSTKTGRTDHASISFSDLPSGHYTVFVQAINTYILFVEKWSSQSNWLEFDVRKQSYEPSNVVAANGHTYFLYDSTETWTFARDLCKSEDLIGYSGGYLATVTSAAENEVITELLRTAKGDGYWLGGYNYDIVDYNSDSTPYQWVTGETFSYTNWNTGEPNGTGSGIKKEHFLEIRKSYANKWNDMPNRSSGISGFIMELDREVVIPVDSMTLNTRMLFLEMGKTAALTAAVSPSYATGKSIVWSSGDPAVAIVSDSGEVTAVGKGKTAITATAGTAEPVSCDVEVQEVQVPVESVKLNKTALTLAVGDKATLTATVEPYYATEGAVTWSVSDSKVATFSDGDEATADGARTATVTVTAAGAGKATVTATAGGKTATCAVTFVPVAVQSVALNQKELSLTEGDTVTLTAIISPSNVTDKTVTWSSSNTTVAEVSDSGEVTAKSEGTATVTAKVGDKTETCAVKVEKRLKRPEELDVHFKRTNIYHQDQFKDVPADQWYTGSVAHAFEVGLMKGSGASMFNPFGDVTVAETVAMAARIHSIYTTQSENFRQSTDKWYQTYLDYALENEIISRAYYNSDVTNKATRAQFAEILANALPEEALAVINNVVGNAIPDVKMTDSFADSVYKLYRAGILTGSDAKGTFSPQTYITRAEAAAIVSRMAESDNRVTFTLK